MDGTISFYDENSEDYSLKTFGADMSGPRAHLTAHLPPGASLLDLGCGSGRDTRAFLQMGYRVTALDASEGMCAITERNTGIKALRMRFQDIVFEGEFDGVWACCSLLHSYSAELPDILARIRRSLKGDGVFFCCFKKGEFEGERDGRHYLDMDCPALKRKLEETGFEVIETWEETEPGRDLVWTNALSRIRA